MCIMDTVGQANKKTSSKKTVTAPSTRHPRRKLVMMTCTQTPRDLARELERKMVHSLHTTQRWRIVLAMPTLPCVVRAETIKEDLGPKTWSGRVS